MKSLIGRIESSRVKLLEVPGIEPGIIQEFLAIEDLTGLVSDCLDALGLPSTLAASYLKPTIPGVKIVGPALTVRNISHPPHDPYAAAAQYKGPGKRLGGMAECEAHNLAKSGDVLVIDGVANTSNIGGLSAQLGQRQGEVGAIVSGGVRDVSTTRNLGFPMWSTEITPVTGKWRLETIEINGTVQIGGVSVEPGDLVIADDSGVCFIPRAFIERVLEMVRTKNAAENKRSTNIANGWTFDQLWP